MLVSKTPESENVRLFPELVADKDVMEHNAASLVVTGVEKSAVI